MASLNIVLRSKANKDGSFPLALRIIKDRKTTFTFLGHYIKEKDWDVIAQRVKKSHPNSTRLNNLLVQKLAEANDKLIELETGKKDVSAGTIKQTITGSKHASFNKQSALYLASLQKAGKFNRFSADKPRIKRFQEFLNDRDIAFEEITVPLLKHFKVHLKATRSITERTTINHLIVIRSIFSQAIDSKVVDEKYYPFGKGKIQIKLPESIKIGLTKEEVQALEEADLSFSKKADHARNVWLFAYYFAGMRVSDVLRLQWSNFQNNRLYYAMGKNNKADSLKVPEKALVILNKYKNLKNNHNLVFPDIEQVKNLESRFEVEKMINQKVKLLNEGLVDAVAAAKINKKVTMHIARHTFGNISGDKIPIQMLQKLYRHTSITTTIGYQSNFLFKDADEALESVLS
jgi:integrase/recombinase XerD